MNRSITINETTKTEELRLRVLDTFLWIYHRLYVKQFALGGINEEEFEELKCLFVDTCSMVRNLLKDFVRKYDGLNTDNFDEVLEKAEHRHVIHYYDSWRHMYHELLPQVENNTIRIEDKYRVFCAYDLLKIANYSLAAWYILEKEKGVTGKEEPALLRKLLNYVSWRSSGSFWYEYPEISFITRAEIWDIAEKHDYGDIHPDDWEGHVWKFFKDKMDEYMAGQSILNANS